MASQHARYVATETGISIAINALISAAFAWLVFGGRAGIPLGGTSGVLLDFVPQTFMISLMSVLVPTLLTRSRLRSGKVQPGAAPGFRLPHNVLLRALLIAVAVTILVGGSAALLVNLLHPHPFEFVPLLVLKVAYGAALAVIVTPFALSHALDDTARA